MSTIVTRAGKGSALTHNEVDANFTNLNTDKAQVTSGSYTGTLTGLTTSPTVTINYTILGDEVVILSIAANVTGTSNANTFTISGAPASIRPNSTPARGSINTINFGTSETQAGAMGTDGVLTLYRSGSATGWTSSGTKGLGTIVSQYIYKLTNP